MFMDFTTFTMPAGITSDEAVAFCSGLFVGAFVRIIRAALRWFKRAGTESHS